MRTFSTLSAITALLVSTSFARMATPEDVERCVGETKSERQEQCGMFRPGTLEYNKCMAHWTDRVLQCYPHDAPLSPQQRADRNAEESHANIFRNEVVRLSRPDQAHYIVGGDMSTDNSGPRSAQRLAQVHQPVVAEEAAPQKPQQQVPQQQVQKPQPAQQQQQPQQQQQQQPQQMPKAPQQEAPAAATPVANANKPKATVAAAGKQGPVKQATLLAESPAASTSAPAASASTSASASSASATSAPASTAEQSASSASNSTAQSTTSPAARQMPATTVAISVAVVTSPAGVV
ncbi:hypothetical protein GGI13_007166, partial [Coemansia sp. RSA 455]